jgi:tetratricopeptide (TPR) repeat protein
MTENSRDSNAQREKLARAAEIFKTGNSQLGLHQYEEALKSYEQAIKLDPNNYAAYNNKGTALNDLGRYDEALKVFDQALS